VKIFIVVSMVLGASFIFSGCTSTSLYEAKYGKEKPIPSFVTLTNKEARNGVFIWRPDSSAAISLAVYNRDINGNLVEPSKRQRLVEGVIIEDSVYLHEQKACVMSSAAARARDSSGGVNIQVAQPAGIAVDLGAVAAEIQKNTLLSTTSEANTFLDVALFGICMSSMNGFIEPKEVPQLIKDVVEKAATIAMEAEKANQRVVSP